MPPLLELREVHAYYGHIHALKGITVEVFPGEIVALVGANGAGKSTTLRTVSGLVRPRQGTVRLEEKAIHHLPPHQVARLGVGHVPERRMIFQRLTVEENLDMGAYTEKDPAVVRARKRSVFELFPRLAERPRQFGGTLSGGEQQMLAIGRALMQNPKLLLMDEPTLGLAPVLVETIFATIQKLNQQGTTILLVEQNARHALLIAHRAYVLQTGEIALHGPGVELADNPEVRKAYLGEE